MRSMLDRPPYGARDDAEFLAEMKRLDEHHRRGCPVYAAVHPQARCAESIEQIPFLHIGMFKHFDLRTNFRGASFARTLRSSATSGTMPSRIALDLESSKAQSESTQAILQDFIGDERRPLVILDSSKSLRARGEISARVAAAMSLRSLASEMRFVLEVDGESEAMAFSALEEVIEAHASIVVYGFTSILWKVWNPVDWPEALSRKVSNTRIDFVHSGGWKKLEAERVDRSTFDTRLLASCARGSRVTDYYGLVEQAGIIYPLCSEGFRHVPIWAEVLVRDPFTGATVTGESGQLHLLNVLAKGAPYHSVLTEDLGRVVEGPCPCGRIGRRFELIGRMPRAELRGCANV